MNELDRQYHEVAGIFPLMQGEEYEALKADIAANGQREPIWVHTDERIIDGRNRYRACVELGIAPQFRTWDGQGSLVLFVLSLNLHRRHLTPIQRAAVAVEILPMLEDEAEARQIAAGAYGVEGGRGNKKPLGNLFPKGFWETTDQPIERTRSNDDKTVYFLVSGDKVKIGTSNDPESREKQAKTFAPDSKIVFTINGGTPLESWLQKKFNHIRYDLEWFRFTDEIRKFMESPDIPKVLDRTDRNERAVDAAARTLNTNSVYVSDMKRYQAEAPDVFEEAKRGTINGNEAKKLARMPKAKRQKVLDKVKGGKSKRIADAIKEVKMEEIKETAAIPTNNKYRVIYADPPWKYGNTMPDYFDEQGDHYQLMTVKEIAAMPVVNMADDNAVLFLWVTSPILEESFQVVNGWGFKYKSSFIWDKVKHVMGHYNSVRHEILLVCTRGSCQPDVQKLFDSVQTIERTEHSTKPEEFRSIIDTIYPHGKRVELFARCKADRWDTWGNEA